MKSLAFIFIVCWCDVYFKRRLLQGICCRIASLMYRNMATVLCVLRCGTANSAFVKRLFSGVDYDVPFMFVRKLHPQYDYFITLNMNGSSWITFDSTFSKCVFGSSLPPASLTYLGVHLLQTLTHFQEGNQL